MTRDEAANMTVEEAQALTREKLVAREEAKSKAQSRNIVTRTTVDLFHAAITAWETVRKGEFDATKNYIGIIVDPQTYLTVAMTGAALKQNAKPGDAPTAESRARMTTALANIATAMKNGYTGPSNMQWAGIYVFVDPRVDYMGVGVFTHSADEAPQVFDADEFAKLQADFEDLLAFDAQEALIEKMDDLGTVPGLVGRA